MDLSVLSLGGLTYSTISLTKHDQQLRRYLGILHLSIYVILPQKGPNHSLRQQIYRLEDQNRLQ